MTACELNCLFICTSLVVSLTIITIVLDLLARPVGMSLAGLCSAEIAGGKIATGIVALTPTIKKVPTAKNLMNFGQGMCQQSVVNNTLVIYFTTSC